jgi:hypothetical protein
MMSEEGCKFCNESEILIEDDGIEIYINEDELRSVFSVSANPTGNPWDQEDFEAMACVKIKYCPMCGRMLVGKDD